MATTHLIGLALDYPLSLRGGVSVIVESLLKHLSPEFRVLLISPDDQKDLKAHPCWNRLEGHIQFDPRSLTHSRAREFARNLVKRQVTLVNFHGGGSMDWGNRRGIRSPMPFLRRSGVPCIYSAHQIGGLLEGYCAADRPWYYKLALLPPVWLGCLYAFSSASQIITDSKNDADQLKRQYPLVSKKIRYVYHSRLDPATSAEPSETRENVVLSVGHVAFRKGQHILAEAFSRIAARFPDWKLNIAGPILQADCAKAIEESRKRCPDQILLLDSHEAPQQLMKKAGIFVQPSLIEAFGLALQEAMFFQCACIGTKVGGIPELISDNRSGLLCESNNIDKLALAIASLIESPEKRLMLGRTAHAEIVKREMTGPAMAANYEKIYRQALKLEK